MHYSVADRPPLLNFFGRPGPRADLSLGPGGPAPSPLLSEFCSFVNVFRIVLRALLLKYIFCNKHC